MARRFPIYSITNYVRPFVDRARDRVLFPDRRSSVAERESGRLGGCFRRYGLPDGFRAARFRDCVIEGHYGFSDTVHDYIAFAFYHGHAECWSGYVGFGRSHARADEEHPGPERAVKDKRAGSGSSGTAGARRERSECSDPAAARSGKCSGKEVEPQQCGGGGIGRRTSLR